MEEEKMINVEIILKSIAGNDLLTLRSCKDSQTVRLHIKDSEDYAIVGIEELRIALRKMVAKW